MILPGPVLRLPEAFLEAVVFLPCFQDLLLLRGEVDRLRDWLHHGVYTYFKKGNTTEYMHCK